MMAKANERQREGENERRRRGRKKNTNCTETSLVHTLLLLLLNVRRRQWTTHLLYQQKTSSLLKCDNTELKQTYIMPTKIAKSNAFCSALIKGPPFDEVQCISLPLWWMEKSQCAKVRRFITFIVKSLSFSLLEFLKPFCLPRFFDTQNERTKLQQRIKK